ncbi:MAG: uracil-DNA glycosylase [Firmicutes bacterium]|nr:uracil-DNA glycosylase [Bacillota bacterium]
MKRPHPAILPEDVAPVAGKTCRQCELADHGTRVIWGEGSPGAPVFVVLDNPGAREDKNGVPFLCGTRETMQKAAYEAGIESGLIYVSYILKCRPRKAYDKEKARAICINYLWNQLEAAKPAIVICLGNVVCQSFFGNPAAEVKQLRGKVHAVRDYSVITSYHPLAVRRRPVLYKYFLEDWRLAAAKLKII